MLHLANQLVKEANELKEMCMTQMDELGAFDYMDNETKNSTLELYTKMYNLMDTSLELVVEQTKLFDEIDNKIDKLMEKLEAH